MMFHLLLIRHIHGSHHSILGQFNGSFHLDCHAAINFSASKNPSSENLWSIRLKPHSNPSRIFWIQSNPIQSNPIQSNGINEGDDNKGSIKVTHCGKEPSLLRSLQSRIEDAMKCCWIENLRLWWIKILISGESHIPSRRPRQPKFRPSKLFETERRRLQCGRGPSFTWRVSTCNRLATSPSFTKGRKGDPRRLWGTIRWCKCNLSIYVNLIRRFWHSTVVAASDQSCRCGRSSELLQPDYHLY